MTTDDQEQIPTEGTKASDPTSPLRVMLADDHAMLREGLRRSLEGAGFDVVAEAADGDEAVRVGLEVRPDVLLMDVSMPLIDGVEAARQIHDAAPEIPIVMLTMHADADVVRRAFAAGAIGYVVKDSSMNDVLTAIRLAGAGETAISPDLANSMLAEAQRLVVEGPGAAVRDGAGGDSIITKREEEVLQLVAQGLSTPEVASALFISVKTVKNHLASIYAKLDSRDRTQAVIRALKMGIVKLD